MSEDIDYNKLLYSIQDQIDENLLDQYDFEAILRTATIVWDNTAVQVKSKDFTLVFDLISYECLSYEGFDINE
jgi:predicted nuclease of restriction endonuclease-like RecB superfamily